MRPTGFDAAHGVAGGSGVDRADRARRRGVRGAGPAGVRPSRLMIVTVLRLTESLADRQAAGAVRDRITWKYSLGLELEDQGFDPTVLSEFCDRLVREGLPPPNAGES